MFVRRMAGQKREKERQKREKRGKSQPKREIVNCEKCSFLYACGERKQINCKSIIG
jgi:hypothetical protein